MSHEVVTRNAPVGAEPSDLQLALEAAAGDLAAFEQLVDRWQSFVRAVVVRMQVERDVLGSTDDLAQLVWMKVWRGLPGFRHESAFSTWLHRIAATTVLNARRSRGRRPQTEALDVETFEVEPADDEADVVVRLAIDALPALDRCVFLNKELHGLTWEENADASATALDQHVSVWDVREAHRRAVGRLRRELGDQ